ncbi:tRNA guanosine(34) transglycosylase Tgt [Candidatus Parcubacteria bacterium]|nr:tRNA guanosine(34) transglycosylase Tgt [Patescibacteria group bacterium]MBU4309197.1 tRNA guanosine(34) transglycosylase Tgt [Patescibacteria group bacterium]MBU4432639.1 tRNA guanosine(34) transglycosylase Tgt [Patescibacteria group bacterium]MBU4577558.1 tRNA guanosine(34) transglycosylase Tgt [Patescibacteria group bacterium]MCG2697245.1 tRNA guanosine(34) transglycosylase Tgt [Candidatus Parcubacteria bacterium]
MFEIIKKSKNNQARAGILKTAHGEIPTPFFMPVATQGTVKHISGEDMRRLDASILLSNTYHLMLRPGEALIKKFGGLHQFMNWEKPILTDSGGFQVFSLAGNKSKTGKSLVQLNSDGVKFKSYIDGRKYDLTPEESLRIQMDLGVDIAVCLDECVALPAERKYVEESVALTTHWAAKTKKYLEQVKKKKKAVPLVHAVIQGGLDKELRLRSLKELIEVGFDGYNIGGLSVGETAKEMYKVLDYLTPEMPEDKPRYLMGVGYPENIVEAVKRGVDMFDCVIPTREGRHGRMFAWKKNSKKIPMGKTCATKTFYDTIAIGNAKFANDFSPINKDSKLPELRNLSRAYLHYLFKIKEPLGSRLASLNNLEFYLDLMEEIRQSLKNEK